TAGIREANSHRSSLRLEIRKSQADLASHEARMKSLKDEAISEPHLEVALKGDPVAQKLKADITKAQDIIDDFQLKSPGVMYPSLIASRRQIASALAKLKKRKKAIQEELASATELTGSGPKEELELLRVAKANAIKAME